MLNAGHCCSVSVCCAEARSRCSDCSALPLPMLCEISIRVAQVCLAGSMQTDDCAADTHGCWTHSEGGQQFSACKDTFRGYVCKCPEGAPALSLLRSSESAWPHLSGKDPAKWSSIVRLPWKMALMERTLLFAGWKGDGFKCKDIDECAEGTAQCQHTCKNTPGGYECSCHDGFQLVRDLLTCPAVHG